ncbi:MAG: hypothetical protein JO107_15995 [Hyphomicrobiales bacterium]|nr:hypothetical protein [Hyphomicrobiales bacterium]
MRGNRGAFDRVQGLLCEDLGCIPKYCPERSGARLAGRLLLPLPRLAIRSRRLLRGVPAPYNLPVPPYNFPNPKTLRVGANPSGANFDFDSILQV